MIDRSMGSVSSRLRAAVLIAVIYSSMPFAIIWISCRVALHVIKRSSDRSSLQKTGTPPVALVTGGKMCKALEVCRLLHQAGVRVVLVEEPKYRCAARLSTAVYRFHTVPPPERQQEYIHTLSSIAAAYQVTLFVPVSAPKGSVVDAMAAQHMPKVQQGTPHTSLPIHGRCQGCLCWCASPEDTLVLDNKAAFATLCAQLGLAVPPSLRITSPQQLIAINDTPQALNGQRYAGGSD